MSTFEIRRAGEGELPTLLDLLSQSTPTSRERAPGVFQRINAYPNYAVYLSWQGDRAVGTFALLIMDNLGHQCAPIAVVENVVVDRDQRRRGIGREMLEFAARRAREQGCYKMILASNRTLEAAHRFYESLGFTWQGYTFALDL